MALRFWPENTNFRFMRLRFVCIPLSIFMILLTFAAMGWNLATRHELGLNLGVDFRGGALIEVKTPGPADLAKVRAVVGQLRLGDAQVQTFGAPDLILVRTELHATQGTTEAPEVDRIKAALTKAFPGAEFRRTETVGGKVSSELLINGLVALGIGLIAMMLYVAFRFEWQFGAGAILSLLHDVTLTIGFFLVTQIEFNLSTVAALLTIIGYSINDTVVIYDRIREDMRKYKKKSISDVVDGSVNVTMARTIYTNITVLLAVVSMFLWGGDVIRSFTAAMIFGCFVGTYSTVFIASPTVLLAGYRQNPDRGIRGAEASA